ncbi:MAG: nitrate/nitrite transporter NrtS [Dehalococcoidia bacterium]|nr:nitrate/nitrite transporter NrtS [Dehalococcoidia bacterium]MCB9485107.1 nitrate/nitrite transporter NrtS [Thermoflexaceae bacterium]
MHPPLAKNALRTALVVGTVLTAINQGNLLASGVFPAVLIWKIPLTYSVPYMVSTWAALRISLIKR